MIRTLAAATKRLHIGRFLLIVVLAIILLLVGFVLRGFVPTGWIQQFQIGSLTLPNQVVQTPLPVASKTEQVGVVSGLTATGRSSPTLGLSATPTATRSNATSIGMVTVITLTPTSETRATDPVLTSTLPVSSGQEQATLSPATATLPARPTPLPSETGEPTDTLTPDTALPTLAPELSPVIANIRSELQNLYRIFEVTQVMLQTFRQGQPTGEEITALRAQLIVVDQRMEKLTAQLRSAQAASETFGTDARISPGQVRDLLMLMQEALDMLQSLLANPAADSTTLALAQPILEQLQGMMELIISLVEPM